MKRKGSILIAVLWCIAILSVIVTGALYSTRLGLGAAKNFEDKVQAHYLALAGVEKAKALIYHEAAARKKAARNHSGELYDSPSDFRSVKFGRGEFSVINESGRNIAYGIRDEESRLNINTAGADQLTKLKDMLPETAAAIVDWRDRDSNAQPGGAEKDYYAALKPPYLPRDNEIQTLREMLLIRGVTPELLLGEDANQNGILDPEENDGDRTAPRDNKNGSLEAGWSGIFCVNSSVYNRKANSEPRVNAQTASESELAAVPGITTEIAKAIVAYRDRQKLENIADLLDVAQLAPERPRPNQPNQPTQPNQPQPQGPPQTVGPKLISQDLFKDICDDLTVDENSSIKGAVNINTASVAVLTCLGLSEELAQNVVNYRSSAGFFPNIAHLLEVQGMTRDIFKQISPRITARSETFRILSEGRVGATGARERMEVVVRIYGSNFETIGYRENL